jgi:hypothetical protein
MIFISYIPNNFFVARYIYMEKLNFDYKFYIDTYANLKKYNINTPETAILHYFKYGQNEKRFTNSNKQQPKIPADFDMTQYCNLNPDLKFKNLSEALLHYINHGKNECRPYKKEKYYFSVHMMFHNEESILKEWIEYYLLIGTDHFYLHNHKSTDNSLNILQPYIQRGLVTLKNNTGEFSELFKILNETLQETKGETKWLAIIDSDEFIVPKTCNNIKEFLKAYENAGGLAVNWQVFGTSNVETQPKDRTMIETLTMTSNKLEKTIFKSIIQPLKTANVWNQHICSYFKNFNLIDENHKIVPFGIIDKQHTVEKIQINHYFTRTKEFYRTKAERRKQLVKDEYNQTLNHYNCYNDVKDTAILKYVPLLRKKLLLNETRADIINHLINKKKYKSYLEVGTCHPDHNFNKINCIFKECIDPTPLADTITYKMTSDDAFKIIRQNNKKYDIIFIDGLHEKNQVDKDVYNSLMALNKGGTIVLHDCNPPTKLHSLPPDEFFKDPTNCIKANGAWNGDVYRTIIELRTSQPNLYVCVVDTDWGCGIVHEGTQKLYPKEKDIFTYEYFDAHRKELLNLISVEDFYLKY